MELSTGVATACACVLLAAVLAAELMPASAGADIDLSPPASLPVAAAVEAHPVDSWTDAALARPLFAVDRRPPQGGQQPDAPLPRLAGTVHDGPILLAMFAPEGAVKSVIVPRDGTVAGWTVAEIADGTVTLVRGGVAAKLRLGWADLPVVVQPSDPPGTIVSPGKGARSSPNP